MLPAFLLIGYLKCTNILQAPPQDVLPPGSVALSNAAETELINKSSAALPYKVCKVQFDFIPYALELCNPMIHFTFTIHLLK